MVRTPLVCVAIVSASALGGCMTPLAQNPATPVLAAASDEPPPAVPPSPRRRVAPVRAPAPQAVAQAPSSSAATWQMPWEIMPLGAAPEGAGEAIILSWVPQTGMVRGTSAALAGLGRPLEPMPGPNRTVDTCRDVVSGEATKSGAREVEAVSAGQERRDRKGDYFAPVRMRITYNRPSGWEVREATLTCIVDKRGKIVDAYT